MKWSNAGKTLLNQVILNAYLCVDTFFFMSGLVLTYVFLKEMSKLPQKIKQKSYWILYYVHRYLR